MINEQQKKREEKREKLRALNQELRIPLINPMEENRTNTEALKIRYKGYKRNGWA